MSLPNILIDSTDDALFTSAPPNKFTRLDALLRQVFPSALFGHLEEGGFCPQDLDQGTAEIQRQWYLHLEPRFSNASRRLRYWYSVKLTAIGAILRLPLRAKWAFALRWVGAYNLHEAIDLLSTKRKQYFYTLFGVGTDFALHAAFKGWLRDRDMSPALRECRSPKVSRSPGARDVVILSGFAKGVEVPRGLVANKQTLGYRVVLIIIDYGPLDYPSITSVDDYADFTRRFLTLVRLADAIIVPTAYVRDLVRSACAAGDITAAPISIAFPPVCLQPEGVTQPVSSAQNILADGRRFALTIITFKQRKDFLWLLAVWRHAALALGADIPNLVVVIGGGTQSEHFDRSFIDYRLSMVITIVERPTDAQLRWLYKSAAFVVQPPSLGGLGTILLEAAMFGKFCLCERSEAYDETPGREYIIQLDRDLDAWTNAVIELGGIAPAGRQGPAEGMDQYVGRFVENLHDVVSSFG